MQNITAQFVLAQMESAGLTKSALAEKANIPANRFNEIIAPEGDPLPSDIIRVLNALDADETVIADMLASQFERKAPRFTNEMITAERIGKWRTIAQMSRDELAGQVGIHYNTLYQYERGSRKAGYALRKKIFAVCESRCKELGIKLEW